MRERNEEKSIWRVQCIQEDKTIIIVYCNHADNTKIAYLLAAGSADTTFAGGRGSARGSCAHDNVTRPFNKREMLSSCSLP